MPPAKQSKNRLGRFPGIIPRPAATAIARPAEKPPLPPSDPPPGVPVASNSKQSAQSGGKETAPDRRPSPAWKQPLARARRAGMIRDRSMRAVLLLVTRKRIGSIPKTLPSSDRCCRHPCWGRREEQATQTTPGASRRLVATARCTLRPATPGSLQRASTPDAQPAWKGPQARRHRPIRKRRFRVHAPALGPSKPVRRCRSRPGAADRNRRRSPA